MFPITLLSQYKLYLYALGVACVVAAAIYCHLLKKENQELLIKQGTLIAANQQQSSALSQCDSNTKDLKNKEEKNTADAKVAVEEAKKESTIEYNRSTDILIRKPKTNTVTVNTINGNDSIGLKPEVQLNLKDYLATQDLVNEEIDFRAKQKEKVDIK